VRARSAAELRQRLSSGGFGKEVVDEVLSDLEQAGLVDDEEFARSWVSARRRAGGKARLRWELRRKGVSADLIRQVVDEGIDDESEVEAALEVARKKLEGRPGAAGRPGPQERARLQRLLRGRGFEYEVVEQVMRRVAAEGEG
jgi:regulatory protein